MDEGMDLKSAAADLLATMEKNIVDVPDYDNFILLAEGNSDRDVSAELAKIKADIYAKIPSENHNVSAKKSEKNISEKNKNNSVPAVNSPEKIAVPDIKEPKSGVAVTYHFSPENVAAGGAKSRFNSNIEAIKTLHRIESENRFATSEEQAVMAKYVGWGGIQQAFVSDKVAENISGNLGEAAPSGWENEQKELLELLSPEEYKAARASTLTSFYTPPDVADGIYQALSQFGFEGGNVLEPWETFSPKCPKICGIIQSCTAWSLIVSAAGLHNSCTPMSVFRSRDLSRQISIIISLMWLSVIFRSEITVFLTKNMTSTILKFTTILPQKLWIRSSQTAWWR